MTVMRSIMFSDEDWIRIQQAAIVKGTTAARFIRNLSAQVAKKIVDDYEAQQRRVAHKPKNNHPNNEE